MTDQERLEEIKQDVKMTRKDLAVSPSNEMTLHLDIMLDYMDYLIEQAERVQELENLKDAFDDLDSDYIDLHQENKHHREALEEILNLRNNTYPTEYVIRAESIARKALEESE